MFQGNPNLRGFNEKIEYTQEQLKEYIRCKEDIIYFAEKYFHIISIDKGEILIPLREYQKRILKAFINPPKRNQAIMAPRQSSKTTTTSIFLLHFAIFYSEKNIAVLANKETTAIEILDRCKFAYERLPLFLQPGLKDDGWNKKSLKLENNSKIIAAATSRAAVSGLSLAILYIDEFAKIPDNLAKDFMDSVFPTIYSSESGRIILSSTPVGLNHWHTVWSQAVKGLSDFFPIKINWWELPWGSEEWKQNIIRSFGKVHFAQEYSCQFLGSNSTLIDPDVIERIETREPTDFRMGYFFSIYEHPIPGVNYILSVDSAKGTGKDFSVVQVMKVLTKTKVEQVAMYRCNTISSNDFAEVVIEISQYYNDSNIMIESNDVGGTVASTIWYYFEYDKILNCDSKGLGILSTRKSKLTANLILKKYIENGWMKICDEVTKQELSRYVEAESKTNHVFAAEDGSHDDTVCGLLWAGYFMESKFFDGIDDSGGPIIHSKNKLEDNYPDPIIIISNGFTPDLDEENIKFLEEGGNFSSNLGFYN